MSQSPLLCRILSRTHPLVFTLVAGITAFTAYGCVYAFRKPFTAASFTGMEIWGMQYKIAIVIAQVAGYALSKFWGIGLIAALKAQHRALMLLSFVGVAASALLGFALSPPAWGLFWMFLNGLPLGMMWGVVFSYLEGRRVTEALAALLCVNFIFSSGFVKTVGKWLMLEWGVSEFWMPFATGMFFLPVLLLCVWILEHLPPPSEEDIALRSARHPMSSQDRKALFLRYAPGLVIMTVVYLILTILRDVRDNFAVEIWSELGFGARPAILTTAEIPIALMALGFTGALALIKNNRTALWVNHGILLGGAVLLAGATWFFRISSGGPVSWMIASGMAIFLPYILFNGVIFERLLAVFREKGNVGFLIYIADSFGYLGSVLVLLWRNFGQAERSWLDFFSDLCLIGAAGILLGSAISWGYFQGKARRITS